MRKISELEKTTHELNVYKIELEMQIEELKLSEEKYRLFLANMSHEIRTPMNGILGFSELLKDPKLTGEEQKEYVTIIKRSGDRMLNIINDIVDISKIESGLMDIRISDTNINDKLQYIEIFFRPEIEQKKLKLIINNNIRTKKLTIQTDKEKLYAILTNLVKNAIKFTDKGSIEIGCNLKNEFLEFYVKDTGIGISVDKHNIIFDRFRQVIESLNRVHEGSGLGLPISKHYTEMLGGEMWLESEFGKGSTFYFTIPNKTKEKIVYDTVVKNINIENKKKLNILIVEDDEISLRLLKSQLKSIVNKFYVAKSGIEAIKICKDNIDIDLILMDIRMPNMDGLEATKQIRKFNKDVIIIAQTAYALEGDREKSIKSGCNDYISKPIDIETLLSTIKKYFK